MQPGQVRIIGGQWRGRKLTVPAVPGLRPTPDRVRETLFNWLAPVITGARCLDVFTGSGVLGFEALSRGAGYVEMVDQNREVITSLKSALQRFKSTNAFIYQGSAPKELNPPEQPFDVVFLDPPYQSPLLLPTCFYLESHHYLAEQAYIYLEADRVIEKHELPQNWQLMKAQQAGQVYYHLAQRENNATQ